MIADLLDNIIVRIDPNKQTAKGGEVLVGLGNTQEENEGIVLQHKTESIRYDCLSQYVYAKTFSFVKKDTCCKVIYIEDFSVDTMLSLWIFFNKIDHQLISDNVNLWIEYATHWEQGDTTTTGKAFESYGCLQNALSLHSKNKTAKEKLLSGLSFLDYLITNKINPAHISEMLQVDTYLNAKEALHEEHHKYKNIVSNSEIVTLYIPNKENKKIKVSAIFIEVKIISSIQKVFLRNDENSPTKDGYAFMAVYNSSAKGTGNDIVISVDPLKNIYLKALWQVLEREEEKLWKGKRPYDKPRSLLSYPDNNGPNQPWWDDMGKYTLIASPKMAGKEYGRRISWKIVKHLIKQLYIKDTEA